MSKISVELEVTDELAKAIGKFNGGTGSAKDYEIKQWMQEEMEIAAETIIGQIRQQEEENS